MYKVTTIGVNTHNVVFDDRIMSPHSFTMVSDIDTASYVCRVLNADMNKNKPIPLNSCPFCGGEAKWENNKDYMTVEHSDWNCPLARLSKTIFQIVEAKDVPEWNERCYPINEKGEICNG